ncbi:MAG: NADH-quinone oxidoreductase subunit L [Myxococcota bacterium]
MSEHVNESLRWIPLLPLITAALSGGWLIFARRELPRSVVITAGCGAPLAALLLSLKQVFRLATEFPAGERFFTDDLFTWISAGDFHAEMAFLLDPLSAVMILVVTGVGSLIHLYSVGYMDQDHRDDRGFQRFFCYLNLFTFSMLMLVLGDNLLVLFVGWEGVGLCSYLLIGFWYLDDHNAMCGQKAFVVNRIGDFGFLLGIFLLFWAFAGAGHPVIDFRSMAEHVGSVAEQSVRLPGWLGFLPGFPTWKLLTLAGLCLFLGACGKSAQLPLYVWLPDAMAGPTPVSALIHAATMVTAGVYMVCRLSFVYSLAPGALATVAWVGGLTAIFAATIAFCQKDIKKVLAYSTVSQLGYMFLAAGAMSYSAAIFHLMTHAFFKALLFLGAGSVILGVHHEQNTDLMGGLRRRMPWTHVTFLVGVLAISGVPPLSGFFSKDEILLGANFAHDLPGHEALWVLGLITAAFTAFYMFRLYFLTFTGECRAPVQLRSHIHDPSRWVIAPLVVLAGLAIGGGIVGFPDAYGELLFGIHESNSLHYFLQEVAHSPVHEIGHTREFLMAGLAVVLAGGGIFVAAVLYYYRTDLVPRLGAAVRPLYGLVYNKYFVDEVYHALIVHPLVRFSDSFLYRTIDVRVIDHGGVDGTAGAVRGAADRGLKYLQNGMAQSYVFVMLVGGVALAAFLMRSP